MSSPEKLVSLLNAGEERPFDEILYDFLSGFPSSLHFTLCYSLTVLLEDKLMLRSAQRLVAFAILHQAYSSQQASANPFIVDLVNAFPQHEHLQQQYCNKIDPEPFKCLFRDTSVTNVVADPNVPRDCDPNSPEFDLHPGVKRKIGTGDRNKTTIGLLQNLSLGGLGPCWVRPRPPRLPVLDSELVWLNPDNSHELLWDYGMCRKDIVDSVEYLIKKALMEQLTFAEHQKKAIVSEDILANLMLQQTVQQERLASVMEEQTAHQERLAGFMGEQTRQHQVHRDMMQVHTDVLMLLKEELVNLRSQSQQPPQQP